MKTIITRINELEQVTKRRAVVLAFKGLDGIACEGQHMTQAEFERRYPEDQYIIYIRSVGMNVGRL